MSTLGDMLKYLPPRLAEAIAEECGRLGTDDGAGAGQQHLPAPETCLTSFSLSSRIGQFLPVVGLLKMGKIEYAKRIMKDFLACCRKGGFSECFSSKDGSGQRDRFLNWSVCVYVLFTTWLRQYGEK